MEMTFDEYLMNVEVAYRDNPEWRWGQTYWNVLDDERPDLAHLLTLTELDPFHKEPNQLGEFLAWLGDHWIN